MKVMFNNLAVPMQYNIKQSDAKHKNMLNFKAVNIKNKNPYIKDEVRNYAVWFDELLSHYMDQHPRHGVFSYIQDKTKEIVLFKNPSFKDGINPKDINLSFILFEEKLPKGRIKYVKYVPGNKEEPIYYGERHRECRDNGVWEPTKENIEKASEKFIEYARIFQKLLAPLKESPIKEIHNESFDYISHIN